MRNFNIDPKKQINLYGHDNIFLKITDLYNKKKLPNKILFYGNSGIGKATLSYHLINYILSNNEQHPYDIKNFMINNMNKSHKLIANYSHPNFFHIDLLEDKKFIEISQIREMINYTNKSSFNNNKKIILIDNVEKLNLN
jgi:DNA polymerase-3 subunit delta'